MGNFTMRMVEYINKNTITRDKTIHLCTLSDSNYLDKGLALYDSLRHVCSHFKLYYFAMDEAAARILSDLNLRHVRIITCGQFETEELLAVKKVRSKGEYCWTCTPVIIKYVLEHYGVSCCTYIESDLYFYESPAILLREFYKSGKSAGLSPHNFPDTDHGRMSEKRSGKYCVQFNTFANDENGKKLLELWRLQCLETCSMEKGGDQLYLTDWGEKYECVHVYRHPGAGVAPWNLPRFKIRCMDHRLFILSAGKKYRFIFYHFQGMRYGDNGSIHIHVITIPDGGLISKKVIREIYDPYIRRIEKIRRQLADRYGLKLYTDGCGRDYGAVRFDLIKFCRALSGHLMKKSWWEALDLSVRVIRKREDILYPDTIPGGGNYRRG